VSRPDERGRAGVTQLVAESGREGQLETAGMPGWPQLTDLHVRYHGQCTCIQGEPADGNDSHSPAAATAD
jgi:hypothetical protein